MVRGFPVAVEGALKRASRGRGDEIQPHHQFNLLLFHNPHPTDPQRSIPLSAYSIPLLDITSADRSGGATQRVSAAGSTAPQLAPTGLPSPRSPYAITFVFPSCARAALVGVVGSLLASARPLGRETRRLGRLGRRWSPPARLKPRQQSQFDGRSGDIAAS
ncbi:hypothetical protein K402DRAFT_45533 [Aulographum hederae CBS 113979]|uniref:Uncharacterized protein n=1 Tax=Aulographum hederae CBS 113979 TaxID=1176131 RepID=A0A6G1H3H8_9PEZI|nr:hypothetical protein K402DRAFT_45533 [Aulographum hederae CBS 113979]